MTEQCEIHAVVQFAAMKQLRISRAAACSFASAGLFVFVSTATAVTLQTDTTAGAVNVFSSRAATLVETPATGARLLDLPANTVMTGLASDGVDWWLAGVTHGRAGEEPSRLALRAGEDPSRVLAVPTTEAQLVRHPVPIVRTGQGLAALAWLEGDDGQRTAVRLARLENDGWQPAETLSPTGPGTQIALSGVQLTDGSTLLVWTAFDGRDDEILWSRVGERGFTPPAPVAPDNHVPDITPRLIADGAGALLAWSRFDGRDYRVQVARFDGQRWGAAVQVGVRGSVSPSWVRRGGQALVLHEVASPSGWALLDLDSSLHAIQRAEVPTEAKVRPFVDTGHDGSLVLRWQIGLSAETTQRAPVALRAIAP